ncbi:Oxidoreductase, molybdopterin-binding domain-containing protein [Halenospora varia]|nr:Oxidoreductase, molybdopterin-binding domain-containing protein [Halenospora varia]
MQAPRYTATRVIRLAAQQRSRVQVRRPLRLSGPSIAFVLAGASVLAAGVSFCSSSLRADDGSLSHRDRDLRDPTLPRFRLSDIRKHHGKSGSPWVTRGDKVYNITDWVAAHPGGEVILEAAGGSIDPYWDIFTIHKTAYIYEILEQYRIGFVHSDDLVDGKPAVQEIEDPFQHDPLRSSRLRTITAKPCNAETSTDDLSNNSITPNELFYVRNHMWVPKIEEQKFALEVELLDGTTTQYTMQDLRDKFKPIEVSATLQCAGNRRNDMTTHVQQTNGLQWKVGAISTAVWEGVRLSDVLIDAGFPVQQAMQGHTEAKHIQFLGSEAYGASIPIESALNPYGDVMLAHTMNGEPLPRDHGFPLRAIVPGHVAARSVKWLKRITVSDEESHTQWQRRDYKSFGPNETHPDWDKASSIQERPITSAITNAKIVRVDVSTDNGDTWDQAALLDDEMLSLRRKSWTWTRWQYKGTFNVARLDKQDTACSMVVVKATDEAYNSQPESHKSIYNARGNLANAWHRLKVCSDCNG